MKPQKGYRAAVEYIALNDEPLIMEAEVMAGYPSVQAVGVGFGKTDQEVAEAVIKSRRAAEGRERA